MIQLQSELKLIQNSHHIIPIPADIGAEIHASLGKRVICEVNGKKRSIMHMINSAKRVDTQINRALKIVEELKQGLWNKNKE